MSVQGWRSFAQALRFQPPEHQVKDLTITFGMGPFGTGPSDAAERERNWDVVKEAIPTLLSRKVASNLHCLDLEWLDAGPAAWVLGVQAEARVGPLDLILRGVEFSEALVANLKRVVASGSVQLVDMTRVPLRWLRYIQEHSVFSVGKIARLYIILSLIEDENGADAVEHLAQLLRDCSAVRFLEAFSGTIWREIEGEGEDEVFVEPIDVPPSRGLLRLLNVRPCPSRLGLGGFVDDLLSPAHLQYFEECLREGGSWSEIHFGPVVDQGAALDAGIAGAVAIAREVAPSVEITHN